MRTGRSSGIKLTPELTAAIEAHQKDNGVQSFHAAILMLIVDGLRAHGYDVVFVRPMWGKRKKSGSGK